MDECLTKSQHIYELHTSMYHTCTTHATFLAITCSHVNCSYFVTEMRMLLEVMSISGQADGRHDDQTLQSGMPEG